MPDEELAGNTHSEDRQMYTGTQVCTGRHRKTQTQTHADAQTHRHLPTVHAQIHTVHTQVHRDTGMHTQSQGSCIL